jgi:hypothetical protein
MKKSQIKMGETIMVLVVFFFLVVLGLIFYGNYQANSMGKQKDIDAQRSAMKFAIGITRFQELFCPDFQEGGCFDKKKLEYFANLSNDITIKRDFILTYSDVFGTSKISVVQVYPSGGDNYTLYNVTSQKSKKIKRNFLPVIIRDSESDLNKYGYLEIETYQ